MGSNGLDKWFVLALLVFLAAGCASPQIKPVRNASATLGEGKALVAFSVATAEPFAIGRIELRVSGNRQEPITAAQVPVDWNGGDARLFLFEVPAGLAQFGQVRFVFLGEWWETREPGPAAAARPGSLTYLGRVQPYSIQIGRYVDTGRGYPAAVKIRVVDAREDDLSRLANDFALPAALPVTGAVPDAWGDTEFSELRYRPIPGRERVSYLDYWMSTRPLGPPPPPPPPQPRKP